MRIILEDISFYYKQGNIRGEKALKQLNLEFQDRRCYLLTGPCGSGKTTLALILKGLVLPKSGNIFILETSISLSSFQRSIGLSFQFPEEQIFMETVEQEIAFGPRMLGLKQVQKKVKEGITSVGLSFEEIRYSSPFDLSSGEQRRVAIASIIACEPSWLILDEPTAGLDFEGRGRVVELVKQLRKEKKTVIIISQELGLFLELCDEVIVLEKGRLKLKADTKTFLEEEKLGQMECSLPYHIRVLRELRRRGWNIPVSITDPHKAATIIEEYKM